MFGYEYTSTQIKPYIKFEGYEDVGRLYEEKLQLRTFTEADVKVPGEKALIGQSMVVANRRIAQGEVVGVYGGTLRPRYQITREQDTFNMLAGHKLRLTAGQLFKEPMVISGDNITSRINTIFEYDATGKPISQAGAGYNIERIGFDVQADELYGKGDKTIRNDYVLTALFATEDIAAGTELRMDYGYTDAMIKRKFP